MAKKLTTYIVIMSGMILLFYFAGLIDNSANSTLLTMLLEPSGFQNSPLALRAIVALELIIGTAIVVGFAIAGNVELGIMSTFAIYLFNLLWDFIIVFNKVREANPVIAILLFSPLIILYIVTIIEWWRGID